MSRIDDAISDALGVTKEIKQEIIDPKPLARRTEIAPDDSSEHIDIDYKYSRENFYHLIERGQDAIEGILDLAKEQ